MDRECIASASGMHRRCQWDHRFNNTNRNLTEYSNDLVCELMVCDACAHVVATKLARNNTVVSAVLHIVLNATSRSRYRDFDLRVKGGD